MMNLKKISFFDYSPKTIGIEREPSGLKAATVSFIKGKAVIDKLNSFSDCSDVKRLYKEEETPSFLTSLPAGAVLVRSLELPPTKTKDLPSLVKFQVEPQLPFAPEEAVIAHQHHGIKDGKTHIKAFVAKKEVLSKHIEDFKTLGIEPEQVSGLPAALAVYAGWRFPSDRVILLHISEEDTSCTGIEQGRITASHNIAIGCLGWEREPKSIEKWSKEAARMVLALQKTFPSDTIVITGSGSAFSDAALQISVIVPLNVIPHENEHLYALPIALALQGSGKGGSSINFREGEFSFPIPWNRIARPASLFLGLALLLALFTLLAGNLYLGNREKTLKMSYAELVVSSTASLNSFEEEYRVKNHLPLKEGAPLMLQELSSDDITSRLLFFEKELKSTPEVFPLQPNIPRVCDFLTWLSSHPQVVKVNKDGTREPLLLVESLNYTLVKRPDNQHKNEKYQVKIDLEFSAPSPTEARQFHDALIAANPLVDPKAEVKWNTAKGKYRTTFYLKDKTTYSSLVTGAKK